MKSFEPRTVTHYLKKEHSLEQNFSEVRVHKNHLTGLQLMQTSEPTLGGDSARLEPRNLHFHRLPVSQL